MIQINKAPHRQTPAERLDTTPYVSPFPQVARIYAYLMLSIMVRLERNAAGGAS